MTVFHSFQHSTIITRNLSKAGKRKTAFHNDFRITPITILLQNPQGLVSDLQLHYTIITLYFTMWWYTVLQIRAAWHSITTNLQPLTAHIYHAIIIVIGGFSKKCFYYYFLEILLNNLELAILEFKHFYETQKTSLFSFYLFIFTCFFVIILHINTL